ncbi:GNAT family N-acetyltransferase [Shewanella amazonensis]|uniref:BioF2-like acetyltransferase domain-containing protein n=1 Tax=Shewanella amazonensis (strain ATCC BAA-1098 / SB2B) TaxID=326297 RepID=A1S829_SHEAM|nr:GNAT family N-acetyltransferase [Shewanella amazonensis]ABM00536.1 conserved hypothetical protein [Shewanella amazonensis SB2B]
MIELDVNALASDIYYRRSYISLYENDAEYFEYTYQEGQSRIRFCSLKRRIDNVLGVPISDELYDLETPYGYGGPLSNSEDQGFLNRAFAAYKSHCKQHNIVCEFIRFHPLNPLAKHSFLFNMCRIERHVVAVELTEKDTRRSQYSKTTRNIIKKAESQLDIEHNALEIDQFSQFYFHTMERNKAEKFYFFDNSYFHALLATGWTELLAVKYQGTYASLGLFMIGNELAHYHLSANNHELMHKNGNYLLLDAAFELARSHGCQYMLLGGGRTAQKEDSLFLFKSKFSKKTLPFYIAGIDFMPEKRIELNKLWCELSTTAEIPARFQLYRALEPNHG